MAQTSLYMYPPPSSNRSASKIDYILLYNSSRSLAFEQIVFGSPNKPDGRNGKN